jgi:hypothetical protein
VGGVGAVAVKRPASDGAVAGVAAVMGVARIAAGNTVTESGVTAAATVGAGGHPGVPDEGPPIGPCTSSADTRDVAPAGRPSSEINRAQGTVVLAGLMGS